MRTMDFTTEQPDCCQVGDYLEVEENQLPTSYWYMLEHAYGASTNWLIFSARTESSLC